MLCNLLSNLSSELSEMLLFAKVAFLVSVVHASVTPKAVTPEFLDTLLSEGRHEELSYHLGIPDPRLVRAQPFSERSGDMDPRFHLGLKEGDMIVSENRAEEERQGINFTKYAGSRWVDRDSSNNVIIPVAVSSNFTDGEKKTINEAMNYWNQWVKPVKLSKYDGSQRDYIFILPGEGCWSQLGRRFYQQSLSLGPGCVSRGTYIHEMEHACGMSHEQNRLDRDRFIEMQWNNIPERWKDQYEKNDPNVYILLGNYDYYSIMHYPVNAPGTNLAAFKMRYGGYDEKKVGTGNDFTWEDLKKIELLYSQ